MKRYLSFGGGVNSTALLLMLRDDPQYDDVEAVFVNHGCDYPETYEYVDYLRKVGYAITEIRPDFRGFDDLYDYCIDARIVPTRFMRWCTQNFKIKPLHDYFETPCEVFIGIDADEERRAKDSAVDGMTNRFQLIEQGIGRQGCIDIIEAHGLRVPPKSGCYICPFQRRSQWVELNQAHPELWCKAIGLERVNIEAQSERRPGDEPMYLADKPLDSIVRAKDARGRYADDDQLDLFDDRRPCQCGL